MLLSQPTLFQSDFTIENFFKKLKEDLKLSAAHCKKCGFSMIPPRPVCSRCLGSDLEWVPLPKIGKVVSFSEVHVGNEIFQKLVPYTVCIASFSESLKIPGVIKDPKKRVEVGSSIGIEIHPESNPAYMFVLL